jgi:coiled-coil domain-containing protein 130
VVLVLLIVVVGSTISIISLASLFFDLSFRNKQKKLSFAGKDVWLTFVWERKKNRQFVKEMSSLAAARADNFYIHPEWRPEFGGISKFAGSTGANQYQKHGVIRFELPFDGWCTKCERHISKGTRFNAKKDKGGKYFTTQIWSFSMKCASCDNEMIIKTDPENNTYDYSEGIRKMEQDYEIEDGDSLIAPVTDEERALLANDPIYRLQHEKEDLEKARSGKEQILNLLDHYETTRKNDYDVNAKLRLANRKQRKRARELTAEGEKRGLMVPLLEPNETDVEEAKEAMRLSHLKKLRRRTTAFDIKERKKMISIQTSSIFSQNSAVNKDQSKNNLNPSSVSSSGSSSASNLLSSAARDRQTLEVALHKQAQRNINLRKFSLQPRPPAGSGRVPSSSSIKKAKRKTLEEGSMISPPLNPLGLLVGYGSDESS